MDHVLYVEVNLICILIISLEIVQLMRGIDKTPRVRLFTIFDGMRPAELFL